MEHALSLDKIDYFIRDGFLLKKQKILNGVDFDIQAGEAVGLVGQNGAGKTTLLKICSGILSPSCGQALIMGQESLSCNARKKISFLTENQYIYPYLTLKEWLYFLGRCSGVSTILLAKRVASLIDEFELNEHIDSQIKVLSKGQKQRALISQLFLNEPKILILDEPMSGLDHVWREHMRVKLNNFRDNGGTVFFSSHILYDIETICDRIVYLKDGEVRWDGSVDEILSKSSLTQVVLKKDGETSWNALGDILWERGNQVSVLIPTNSFGRLQHELAKDSSLTILRVNPYIPSLEAMFAI